MVGAMKTTFIYGLLDPRDMRLRYVGKSNNPKVRYRDHVTENQISHKASWIKGLSKLGLRPILIILDEVSRDGWEEYERAWIAAFRVQLTNTTEGGECPQITPETRAKIADKKRGIPLSPEHRAKLSAIHKGKPKSATHRANISKVSSNISPELRAKMNAAMKGRTISADHIAARVAKTSKVYIVISPDGDRTQIKNLSFFCRENGLTVQAMCAIAHGRAVQHKGWKCEFVE
jgi:hypothetical protein